MLYINSLKNNLYGVIDTDDNTEEYFTKKKLLDIVRNQILVIDGVDVDNNAICIVKPINQTLKDLRNCIDYKHVLYTMSMNNSIGLRFKSKPTTGEMSFVKNQVLNISRSGIDDYYYDLGYSKSYKSSLSLIEMTNILNNFKNWKLVECKIGRY